MMRFGTCQRCFCSGGHETVAARVCQTIRCEKVDSLFCRSWRLWPQGPTTTALCTLARSGSLHGHTLLTQRAAARMRETRHFLTPPPGRPT